MSPIKVGGGKVRGSLHPPSPEAPCSGCWWEDVPKMVDVMSNSGPGWFFQPWFVR